MTKEHFEERSRERNEDIARFRYSWRKTEATA